MKLSVANCLPFLVASPSDKQQRATDLLAACQKAAVVSQQEEVWQMGSHAPHAMSPRAKLELSLADLQRFMDCLLRPDKASGAIKVLNSLMQARIFFCKSSVKNSAKLRCDLRSASVFSMPPT